MPKRLKLQHTLGLILMLVVLQSCTCWGVPLDQYFQWVNEHSGGSTQSQTQTEPAFVPTGMNCNDLTLTSPLGGLPNGTATFYWDALAGATSYQINLYADGTFLTGFNAAEGQTNLSADVSWNAVGGQYSLQVELVAKDANGSECKQMVTLAREAPAGGDGSGGSVTEPDKPVYPPTMTPPPI